MPIFLTIKEEELEEIRLLKADGAVSEDALENINALLNLVDVARKQIIVIDARDPVKFAKNFLQDSKENGKFHQLIQILETELQNADAELDEERERIERLSSISAKIVNVMERLSSQESFLLKLPVVLGRGIIKKLKNMDDKEKRQLQAKAKSFKFLISWLNFIKVNLRDLSYSVPFYIYSVASHGKSARESYGRASGSYDNLGKARELQRITEAFLKSDRILQDVEMYLTAIKEFLNHFKDYLNKTSADNIAALQFEQMLVRLELAQMRDRPGRAIR